MLQQLYCAASADAAVLACWWDGEDEKLSSSTGCRVGRQTPCASLAWLLFAELNTIHLLAPPSPPLCPRPQAFVNEQGGRHKFFNVWPYIKPLRAWIK